MASIHQEQGDTTLPCLLTVNPSTAFLEDSEHIRCWSRWYIKLSRWQFSVSFLLPLKCMSVFHWTWKGSILNYFFSCSELYLVYILQRGRENWTTKNMSYVLYILIICIDTTFNCNQNRTHYNTYKYEINTFIFW